MQTMQVPLLAFSTSILTPRNSRKSSMCVVECRVSGSVRYEHVGVPAVGVPPSAGAMLDAA